MTKGDVVTLVLINGAEIIGRFVEIRNTITILNKPRMVQVSQEGLAMIPGLCMTGVEPKGDFQFNNNAVLFVIPTVEQLAAQYEEMTSSIIIPKSKGLIQ